MSHKTIIANLLRERGKVTLRELFESGVGYEGRSRICELKKSGWVIEHIKGETPSDNAWVLISEPGKPMKPHVRGFVENKGQMEVDFDLRYD